MYDIVIVGAGIAGLTAAIYGCRAGKKVLVLAGKAAPKVIREDKLCEMLQQ